MKKMRMFFIIGATALGIALSGAAFAGGPQQRHHRFNGKGKVGRLIGCVQRNLGVQALSEMTGQPVDVVRQQLRENGMRAFFKEHKIERAAFRQTVQGRIKALSADLAKDGYITPEQQKRVAERAEFRAQRRALMSRLVERGIADGVITPQQGGMLMGKRY